jgi:hypothetical protein
MSSARTQTAVLGLAALTFAACTTTDAMTGATGSASTGTGITGTPLNPDTAPVASVDRFQDGFATLFKRSAPAFDPSAVSAILPAPNAPIDMDKYFTVKALGPAGEKVVYYALDILPPQAVDGYVIVGPDGMPVAGQLAIIKAIPGDMGYNDFVEVNQVKVGAGYMPNTITSYDDIMAAEKAGQATESSTHKIANWAIVPKGTTATLKFNGKTVTGYRAWYKHQVADYLLFDTDLPEPSGKAVPTSGIIVIFTDGMSPAKGFAAEPDGQTHNALQTLPGQMGYSSYWSHMMGKLSGFDSVKDYPTAQANVSGPLPVLVNCPVVAP